MKQDCAVCRGEIADWQPKVNTRKATIHATCAALILDRLRERAKADAALAEQIGAAVVDVRADRGGHDA